MIFALNFHQFLHIMYKCVLNSVVKISLMFAQYFEFYAIILRGGCFLTLLTANETKQLACKLECSNYYYYY